MSDDKKYDKATLNKKTLGELKELFDGEAIDPEVFGGDKPTKTMYINSLIEVPADDADDELDDDELDDEVDDEAEADDDELDDDEELEPELPEEEDEVDDEPAEKPKKSTKKAAAKKDAKEGDTLAAKQVATILGTEPKTLRQFFRSPASTVEAVGSGGRYEFLETDIDKIKSEFEAWRSAHAARGTKRGAGGKKGAAAVAAAEVIEEVEEIEELEDEELDNEIDDDELELDEK